MNDGERDSLLKWLEESGQALELRVARAFLQAGLEVAESFMYEDWHAKQLREGDLLVHLPRKPGDEASILLVIECKHSGAKEKQWIGVRPSLERFRPLSSPAAWLSWTAGSEEGVRAAQEIAIRDGLVESVMPCSRVLTAHANHNPAYNAARQVLSATYGVADRELASGRVDAYGNEVVEGGALGVVVTTASLKTCGLSKSGKLTLREVTALDVLCEAPSRELRPVRIMNEEAIADLISRLVGSQ